jgi:hypothetical protein
MLLELTNEHFVPIGDEHFGHVVELIDVVHEQLCHGSRYKGMFQGQEMSKLGKFMHHHQDCVKLA